MHKVFLKFLNYKKLNTWFKGSRGQKILLIVFGVAVVIYMTPQNDVIEGQASAIGGIGLEINSQYVVLYGINSLSPLLKCKRGKEKIACVQLATNNLASQIKNRYVKCERKTSVKKSLVTGYCLADGLDLSKFLVRNGWATAAIATTDEYLDEEVIARRELKGIWATHKTADPRQ